MSWYRVYFLSAGGDIRNADDFDAPTDEVALTLADGIHEAVSDLYAGYEVWHESRLVFRCPNRAAPRHRIPHQIITRQIQCVLLRREISLQNSDTAFSRSHRLVERINELQEIVGPLRSRNQRTRAKAKSERMSKAHS